MSCLCENISCKFKNNEEISRQKLIVTLPSKIDVADILHILMSSVKIINLDLSFGTCQEHFVTSHKMDEAIQKYYENSEFNIPIAKMCTVRGKASIVGRMRNDKTWLLNTCDLITLTSDERYRNCSTNQVCFISNFENLIPKLQTCDVLFIGDEIELRAVKILEKYVTCYVRHSGILESYQKLRQLAVKDEKITDQEIQDINFATIQKFDFIVVPNVKSPKYFHAIEKHFSGCDVRLIAKVDKNLESELILKIFEHFHGFYAASNVDFLRNTKFKPIIAAFVSEKPVPANEINDCLEFKFNNFSQLDEAIKTITETADEYENAINLHEKSKDNISSSEAEDSEKLLTKAVICITETGDTVNDAIENFRDRYVVALTKDENVAKKLQLLKNVVPMIYVECSEKPWSEQMREMKDIAVKFLLQRKIVSDVKFITLEYEE